MVAAVDQRDLDRRARQPVGRLQPAEAGSDDDDAMRFAAMIYPRISLLLSFI